jgi:hypothetical protein
VTTTSRRLKHGVQAAAFIGVAIGISGVVGWAFGIRQLLSITDDAPALMPMSALALMVAGASLGLWEFHPRVARAFGAALIGLVIMAALGYTFHTDFGLGGVPADLTRGAGTLPGLPAWTIVLRVWRFAGFCPSPSCFRSYSVLCGLPARQQEFSTPDLAPH